MIIEAKTRGFICTTAHPVGCSENVREQIAYIKNTQPHTTGAKRVLVLGASAGYGLATRIAAAFAGGAATIGVIFDKPAQGTRTATAGWYNTAAFERYAAEDGLYAKTLNGDAFSQEMKAETAALIRKDWGQVDLIVYSLASPRRTTSDGVLHTSVLKTTGEPYTNRTIDLRDNTISSITIPSASKEEIADTITVMGGEDWRDWIAYLDHQNLLAPNAVTVAYSYVGPALTHPIYYEGSIGRAKQHLYRTAKEMTESFPSVTAQIAVNKAVVTQSSAAIPIVPLYVSLLYRVMKEQNLHEGCIEQMARLWKDGLCEQTASLDEENRIRLDDWEMRQSVQETVAAVWEQLTTENVQAHTDISGYWEEFFRMFGFGLPQVDYRAEVEADLPIPSILKA